MKTVAIYALVMVGFLMACHSKVQRSMPERKHTVEIVHKDGSRIYLDTVGSDRIIHITRPGNTRFASILVGNEDYLAVGTPKEELDRGKHFQYDVVKDWVAVAGGDSIRPVFYEPRPVSRSHVYEGMLVFEVPSETAIDTLVYHDSYGAWGTQTLVLRHFNYQTH